MDGNPQDLLVGTIAAAVGVLLLVAMLADWEWFRALRVRRFFEAWLGVRWMHAVTFVFATGMIVAGVLIARGFSLVTWLR